MVALPAVQLHTVSQIYTALVSANEQFDSIGLSISLLGGDCDRALWYALRWASAPEQLSGQKVRRFQTGHIEEGRLIEDLRRAGFEVLDRDLNTDRQFKVYAVGGHLRGKLDGKVIGLPEAPKAIHVVECKSHNDKSYKELVKKGLQAAKPNHFAQVQMYMHLEKIERGLYLAVNKNTDDLHAERVRYDAAFCLDLIARVERVVTSNRAPSRIAEDASKYPCIICDHKAVCHREAFGRNHCRTCVHVTPIVDEGTAAHWKCERFGKALTVEDQKAGCPAHLFLPDVVPGDQTDAGDDFIEYELRNGSRWRDGVKAEAAE